MTNQKLQLKRVQLFWESKKRCHCPLADKALAVLKHNWFPLIYFINFTISTYYIYFIY